MAIQTPLAVSKAWFVPCGVPFVINQTSFVAFETPFVANEVQFITIEAPSVANGVSFAVNGAWFLVFQARLSRKRIAYVHEET
jgi:hypothetical protein